MNAETLENRSTRVRIGIREALKSRIKGEVRFSEGDRLLYLRDASNYAQSPIGVVLPLNIDDVVQTVEVCREWNVPILSRGAGTSLAGQCTNEAVLMDYSKYLHGFWDLDTEAKTVWVYPGTVLDDLNKEMKKHGLIFWPDPATHNRCTLGGMIGNNSCGVHSIAAGRTVDNVLELEILTYDGIRMTVGSMTEERWRDACSKEGRVGGIYRSLHEIAEVHGDAIRREFPDIPRRVSGFNLPQLLADHKRNVARALVGTEGTCVVILAAKLQLRTYQEKRTLLIAGFEDVFLAADQVTKILPLGPVGLEGMDEKLKDHAKENRIHPDSLKYLPDGKAWLIAEFAGDSEEETRQKAEKARRIIEKTSGFISAQIDFDPEIEQKIWEVREAGLGATARLKGKRDFWPGWEDSAVAPEKMGDYLRALRKLFDAYGYSGSFYGHFGDGCLHCRIDFDLMSEEGLRRYHDFAHDAARLVHSFGGSCSGEHGDGQARGELLKEMYSPEILKAFEAFKSAWDPKAQLNPGKVVKPYGMLENLRLGPGFDAFRKIPSAFHYPDDDGSLVRATMRCVGVGACRRKEGKTMCPSYRATLDEKHCTRGRAHLLFEMFTADEHKVDWRNEEVKESLDLCLACKGCKSDCPVRVDVATYKAEFLSHYYKGRFRPRSAYAMGLIDQWCRLGKFVPRLANAISSLPLSSNLFKWLGGLAQERDVPRFAAQTFKKWHKKHSRSSGRGQEILLWADTFSNHFMPDIARDANYVLEELGYKTIVPSAHLCCGRPLYDFGMLDAAKSYLEKILKHLKPIIDRGTPIVGLEPSCLVVFKDELLNLFPENEDARRLSESVQTFAQFLLSEGREKDLPKIRDRVVVHGHCQQKAVIGLENESRLLKALGADFEILDSGCCGMAGSFGFEKDKYEISSRIGELSLLPRVRSESEATVILADGFSCREQIGQKTGRKALHIAQLLANSMKAGLSPEANRGDSTL